MNWREHTTVDPNTCHGQPCVKGTRVAGSVVLDNLAVGVSLEEVLRSYPSLGPMSIEPSQLTWRS